MKIIHITASYKPAYIYGGPTMSVAKLCEALVEEGEKSKEQGLNIKEQGTKSKDQKIDERIERSLVSGEGLKEANEVLVFTTTANGKSELPIDRVTEQNIDSVQVKFFKRLTKDHSHFSPSLLFSLNLELRQSNIHKIPTVVHIHAWWNLVSVLSCLIAKKNNIPVILSPRGMLTNYTFGNRNAKSKNLFHHIMGRTLLKYCHIHATSEKEKEDIIRIIKPKNITVLSNLVGLGARSKEQGIKSKEQGKENENEGISTEDKPIPNNQRQPFKLIFLSRIEHKKGLEILLDALSQTESDWRLTIAGSGEDAYVESLKNKAKRLKLEDKITWVGQINNDTKFELLANHDLLALPSFSENFANVVIESLSVGTPVIISEFVGLANYVKEKEFGWVTSLEVKQMAENIEFAAKDNAKRNKIRISAPETILKDFDSKTLINQYINLYECVLNGHFNA